MAVSHRLSPLFDFSSVALVGASDNSSMGVRPYRALQALGYTGKYFPVNARNDEVHGMKAYRNVTSLPEAPDMVIVAIPRDGVPAVIDECAATGVKAATILAAGFADLDQHGAEMQAHITEVARKSGLLVVGPNCLGLVSVANHCSASSTAPPTQVGNVALVSHSGGLMNEVVSCGVPRGVGFSHVISAGNEAGATSADLIDYFVEDPGTDVILGIIETARDPIGFAKSLAKALAARKPVVILKMGRTPRGKLSSFTHTGADAGDDAVYAALFRQHGVIQVNDIDELVDMGSLLSMSIGALRQRRLERAAVIEISGGGKELSCDTAVAGGVELAEVSDATLALFAESLPSDTFPTNPIDTGGAWGDPDKAEVYPATLDAFAKQADIDIVVSRYTIPRTGELGVLRERLIELDAARAAHPDRLFPVLSRTCDQYCEEWESVIREKRLPFVRGYGRGMRTLGLLAQYSRAVHGRPPVASTPAVPAASGHLLERSAAKEVLTTLGISDSPSSTLGVDVVLGARRDAQFGPVVTFGLGGIAGEALTDVALRLAPVGPDDALAMLDEIQGRRILAGSAGRAAVDRTALQGALARLSEYLQRRTNLSAISIEAVASSEGLAASSVRVAS